MITQNPHRPELASIPWLNLALDKILVALRHVFLTEHDEDGHHTNITASSLTLTQNTATGATGDLTADGDGFFDDDVIAQFGTGNEVGLGTLSTVNGTSLLPAEVSRQLLLLGGVSTGCVVLWRGAAAPFVSGKEVAVWNLGHSTTRPLFRVGVLGGVPTLLDGGSGASLALGDVGDPISTMDVTTLTADAVSANTGAVNVLTVNTNLVTPVVSLIDGVTAPTAVPGRALLYVDTADGDLKVIFGDGVIKTLATDT